MHEYVMSFGLRMTQNLVNMLVFLLSKGLVLILLCEFVGIPFFV